RPHLPGGDHVSPRPWHQRRPARVRADPEDAADPRPRGARLPGGRNAPDGDGHDPRERRRPDEDTAAGRHLLPTQAHPPAHTHPPTHPHPRTTPQRAPPPPPPPRRRGGPPARPPRGPGRGGVGPVVVDVWPEDTGVRGLLYRGKVGVVVAPPAVELRRPG